MAPLRELELRCRAAAAEAVPLELFPATALSPFKVWGTKPPSRDELAAIAVASAKQNPASKQVR